MDAQPTSDLDGVTLVTMSFSGDLALFELLCETVDRFVPAGVPHLVAVPRDDLPLFAPFAAGRRRLVTQESLLPPWLHKVPLPGPAWRRRLMLPRRNVYLSSRGRPVRGWIAQQMMKLTATARIETDLVLHIDSDAAFIRPLSAARLRRGDLSRILRVPGAGDLPTHREWHATAARLLGLPPSRYHGADYIDNLVTWRPAVARGLLARIAEVGRDDALRILARTRHLSEYILYGVYCDEVLGLAAAGHFADPESLCETIWSSSAHAPERLAALSIAAERAAIGVQSTIPLSQAERRAIIAAATP